MRSDLIASGVGAVVLFALIVLASAQSHAAGAVGPRGERPASLGQTSSDRPPGGRIAFSAGATNEDIYVVNADGSGLERLTSDPGRDFDPTWSPDGRRIAYRHESRAGEESADIYVMNADGSRKRNLTRRAGPDFSPAWSPDGKRIAFASFRGSAMPTIWVMRTDGSEQRRVSREPVEYPAWSPDGRRIAFDRNTFGATGWDVWVVNADGSRPRALAASPADEQGPAWSPDGGTIAYGSSRGVHPSNRRIWLADADGSHRRLLTRRYGDRPAWTKPGTHLLYTFGDLLLIRRDGSDLRSVPAQVPGEAALADWTR